MPPFWETIQVKTKKKNHGRCHTFSLVNGVRIEQSEGQSMWACLATGVSNNKLPFCCESQ